MYLKIKIIKHIMADKCWICCKDLSKITATVQADLINNKKTWRKYWETKPYKFFFPIINKTTCLECFKSWSSWEDYDKKFKYIQNRKISSLKPKLKFPISVRYDKCAICKTQTEYTIETSIFKRRHYLSGLGQFCPSCYMATANTSTVTTQFYEHYLM